MSQTWNIEEGIPDHPPLIVGFVADLLFSSKIEDVANKLNFKVRWIERSDQITFSAKNRQDGQVDSSLSKSPAEQLSGIEGAMLDQVTRLRPALIIFDCGNPAIPWRDWLPILKSVPATRRIPILCYGSHVDADAFQFAQSAGADAVVARSRLISELPELIQSYARIPDYAGLIHACNDPLSPKAVQGLEEFNHGAYFEAHESLEAAWNEDPSPGRELYRAILQVSVAYLQIERRNYRGAMKIFMRVRQWIDPLPNRCRGVDVSRLRFDIENVQGELIRLGPEKIHEFKRDLLRPIQYEIIE